VNRGVSSCPHLEKILASLAVPREAGEGFAPYSYKAGCGGFVVGRSALSFSLWAFYLQNTRFYSGGTRIRTGDTMIFS